MYGLWAWQEKAACRGVDTEKFFLERGARSRNKRKQEEEAVRICRSCPVLVECRRWALEVPEYYGVWGGLTADQRMQLMSKGAVR